MRWDSCRVGPVAARWSESRAALPIAAGVIAGSRHPATREFFADARVVELVESRRRLRAVRTDPGGDRGDRGDAVPVGAARDRGGVDRRPTRGGVDLARVRRLARGPCAALAPPQLGRGRRGRRRGRARGAWLRARWPRPLSPGSGCARCDSVRRVWWRRSSCTPRSTAPPSPSRARCRGPAAPPGGPGVSIHSCIRAP